MSSLPRSQPRSARGLTPRRRAARRRLSPFASRAAKTRLPVDRLSDIPSPTSGRAASCRVFSSLGIGRRRGRLNVEVSDLAGSRRRSRCMRYRPLAMEPARGYPEELEGLDVFSVWSTLPLSKGRFDPFSFAHRMAAYRTLMEAINRRGQFGEDNRRNPLWALVFQHDWQCRSGRLGPRAYEDGPIDPDAPWGYGNYALCVIPWLAAAASGLVPDLPVQPPP